jgi:hypothetical protein
MFRTAAVVVVADVVLLGALAFVFQDLQWRASYAASLHGACGTPCGYSPSFGFSILTRYFTMVGNGATLTSPPMLDWVQALALILVLVNAWFAYTVIRARRIRPGAAVANP